jgi:hypothetical protein
MTRNSGADGEQVWVKIRTTSVRGEYVNPDVNGG